MFAFLFVEQFKFLYLTPDICHNLFQVNYINAHATSTIVGDLAEVNAIKKVFKNTSEIKINATKVISFIVFYWLFMVSFLMPNNEVLCSFPICKYYSS